MEKTVLVCGCARSGLSLTMQLLYKGGYPCMGEYPAFERYEMGKIDYASNKGKAIKVVDTRLQFPPTGDYYVIVCHRDFKEQAKSTIKFTRTLGIHVDSKQRENVAKNIKEACALIDKWANRQYKTLHIQFMDLVTNPDKVLDDISMFTGFLLSNTALNCVIKRDEKCHKEMLEFQLLEQIQK